MRPYARGDSTEYPADQPIPMHNESSYALSRPSKVHFFCRTAPGTGGATPIAADNRAVLDLIPAEVRERFAKGVVYTRTFRADTALSRQEGSRSGACPDQPPAGGCADYRSTWSGWVQLLYDTSRPRTSSFHTARRSLGSSRASSRLPGGRLALSGTHRAQPLQVTVQQPPAPGMRRPRRGVPSVTQFTHIPHSPLTSPPTLPHAP
ncbi:TauD/TfdA family dioxygenase, partial [Streptomyces antibioticus]|uniref:TauD/TfdA family dioxygenase n=1 Tax=Streptomyces antibioticus TaxID=1890 RepID=UPI0033C76898